MTNVLAFSLLTKFELSDFRRPVMKNGYFTSEHSLLVRKKYITGANER